MTDILAITTLNKRQMKALMALVRSLSSNVKGESDVWAKGYRTALHHVETELKHATQSEEGSHD